ncbi:MAG: prepilin-type N-terminal cleavage/methylation domain-containing protein [Phycisphaerales bacterium]
MTPADRSASVRARRGGMTLIEVMVAAVILLVAGLAALELLAAGDAASLHARRQAVAAVEAERALESAARAVREGRSASQREMFEDVAGEALAGCVIEVSESREEIRFTEGGARGRRMPVSRLVAEVTDRDGQVLVSFERVAPRGAAEVAP